MKKVSKSKNKKSKKLSVITLLVFFIFFVVIIILLPSMQTNKLSYGASIPFTPVPAKSNLQLEWFLLPTSTPIPISGSPRKISPVPTITQPNQPTKPFLPITTNPTSSVGRFPTTPPITPIQSNGQLCSAPDDSGIAVTGSCYCPDLSVICKGGIGYGVNGKLYPGVNPCGTKVAPGNGRYCVEKPVIYLYPRVPTFIDVQVITSGNVVVSNPHYPAGGWKHVLANPNGILQYKDTNYSELFYESSVNKFDKPQQGTTIPVRELRNSLNTFLDHLGLIGHEKQEFLSFWLPRLYELNSPYIFFSVLTPTAKADIDTLTISPKPDTQIAFIAYFKPVSQPISNTLQIPPSPKRQGFVSVEWGGVIEK